MNFKPILMISNKIYQKILTLNSKEFSIFPIFLNSNFKRKFKIFDRIRLIKLIKIEKLKNIITVLRKIILLTKNLKILIIIYIRSPSPSVTILKANSKEK